jgi:hypothetical protein
MPKSQCGAAKPNRRQCPEFGLQLTAQMAGVPQKTTLHRGGWLMESSGCRARAQCNGTRTRTRTRTRKDR